MEANPLEANPPPEANRLEANPPPEAKLSKDALAKLTKDALSKDALSKHKIIYPPLLLFLN
jgi:hypothetical protein